MIDNLEAVFWTLSTDCSGTVSWDSLWSLQELLEVTIPAGVVHQLKDQSSPTSLNCRHFVEVLQAQKPCLLELRTAIIASRPGFLFKVYNFLQKDGIISLDTLFKFLSGNEALTRAMLSDELRSTHLDSRLHALSWRDFLMFVLTNQRREKLLQRFLVERSTAMYDEYVCADAPNMVNLNHLNREDVADRMNNGNVGIDLFDSSEDEITKLMCSDSLQRFRQSKMFFVIS